MAEPKQTPEERIALAEAEEVEAMRDIMKAEARSAAAEAQIIEDLVEVNKAMGNVVMGFTGQGPLPSSSPATVLKELFKQFGKEAGMELLKQGFEHIKDMITSTGEKQKGRAEQTKANAAKEAVIKGVNIEVGGDFSVGGDLGASGTQDAGGNATS